MLIWKVPDACKERCCSKEEGGKSLFRPILLFSAHSFLRQLISWRCWHRWLVHFWCRLVHLTILDFSFLCLSVSNFQLLCDCSFQSNLTSDHFHFFSTGIWLLIPVTFNRWPLSLFWPDSISHNSPVIKSQFEEHCEQMTRCTTRFIRWRSNYG